MLSSKLLSNLNLSIAKKASRLFFSLGYIPFIYCRASSFLNCNIDSGPFYRGAMSDSLRRLCHAFLDGRRFLADQIFKSVSCFLHACGAKAACVMRSKIIHFPNGQCWPGVEGIITRSLMLSLSVCYPTSPSLVRHASRCLLPAHTTVLKVKCRRCRNRFARAGECWSV